MPQPFTVGGASSLPVFSSSKESSSIVVEKKNEITSPLRESGASHYSHSLPDSSDAKYTKTSENIDAVGSKQTETAVGNFGDVQPATTSGQSAHVEATVVQVKVI